jgi:hypothetical protein
MEGLVTKYGGTRKIQQQRDSGEDGASTSSHGEVKKQCLELVIKLNVLNILL